jgi:hypothetical protein
MQTSVNISPLARGSGLVPTRRTLSRKDLQLAEISKTMFSVQGITGANSPKHEIYLAQCSLYIIFLFSMSVLCYLRPLPTYDRLLYAAMVASLRYPDAATIYKLATQEFENEPTRYKYTNPNPYFTDLLQNPEHLKAQLWIFKVKLAYPALGYVLWRAGVPILHGLRVVSAASFFLVGLLMLAWTGRPLPSALIMLSMPVLDMGRMVTADPLATAVVLWAFYFMSRRRYLLGFTILCASVLVRIDLLVLVLVAGAWLIWRGQVRSELAVPLAVASLIATASIQHFAGYQSWRLLMYAAFVSPILDPVSHPAFITARQYFSALLLGLRSIPYTFLPITAFMAVLAWSRVSGEVLLIAAFYVVIRILMFPNLDDRFFVWLYALAGAELILSRFGNRAAMITSA